jgi:hypothetical protein
MNQTDRELMESILTAQVLLLSDRIEREQKAKGVTRVGGDYTAEAVRQIKQRKSAVVQMFLAD